jgi:hypothetical protein
MSSTVRDLTIDELESVSGGSYYVKINNPQPVSPAVTCVNFPSDSSSYCWCDGDLCW